MMLKYITHCSGEMVRSIDAGSNGHCLLIFDARAVAGAIVRASLNDGGYIQLTAVASGMLCATNAWSHSCHIHIHTECHNLIVRLC